MEALKGQVGWNAGNHRQRHFRAGAAEGEKGEYSGITLRNLKPDMLEKYFTRTGEMYKVKPDVKMLVKFSHLNLNDPKKISLINNMDVIFCRNVMIYFSDDVKRQLVRGFYNALKPGGYFYIGHSETLHGISKAFKLVYFKNALVYQKEATSADGRECGRQDGDGCRRCDQSGVGRSLASARSAQSDSIECAKEVNETGPRTG